MQAIRDPKLGELIEAFSARMYLPAPPWKEAEREVAFLRLVRGASFMRYVPRDGQALLEAALEKQVICVPGAFFDIDPGNRRSAFGSRLAGHVRISFGPDEATLVRGLDRFEALIAGA
jgi:aspartate/methionine/tyrosine aminotransferase